MNDQILTTILNFVNNKNTNIGYMELIAKSSNYLKFLERSIIKDLDTFSTSDGNSNNNYNSNNNNSDNKNSNSDKPTMDWSYSNNSGNNSNNSGSNSNSNNNSGSNSNNNSNSSGSNNNNEFNSYEFNSFEDWHKYSEQQITDFENKDPDRFSSDISKYQNWTKRFREHQDMLWMKWVTYLDKLYTENKKKFNTEYRKMYDFQKTDYARDRKTKAPKY